MRLRDGLRVLRRDDTEVQVGTDPRWAVRLGGLLPGEADLLCTVDPTTDLRALPARARAAGLSAQRVEHLVDLLHQALLTVDGPARGPAARPADRHGSGDAAAWSLLRPAADGADLVAARAGRTVAVSGLGPTGLGIAVALAAAGVGTVLLDDERAVRPGDVGVGGYRWADVGAVRERAAARALHDLAPAVAVSSADPPDVLVLVERDAAHPARGPRLVAAGMTHLSVVVRAADTLVGPLVVPGEGPCLRCLDLARTDADPAWPALALAMHPGPTAPETIPRPGAVQPAAPTDDGTEVGTLAAICSGLAAAAVLAHLDGSPHPLRGATAEVALPDALPRWRQWSVHPECGCTDQQPTARAG